jgi:hypothetical protein
MTEAGVYLSDEQLQAIYRALDASERHLKSIDGRPGYLLFQNLQAIRAALKPELLRSEN